MSSVTRYLSAMLMLLVSAAEANTSVWQLSNGNTQLYIAGTVHLLPAEQFPLPAAFSTAYLNADTVVLETDIRALNTPQGMQLLMQHARYQDGRTLQQVLSADTYQQLTALAREQGIDLQTLNGFKPDFVLLTIMQAALQKAGMAGEGVDLYFMQRAQTDAKPLLFLETIDQQLSLLLNASASNEEQFVQQNLTQMADMKSQLTQIISAWRSGNTTELASLAMAFTDTAEGKRFYDILLVQRNKNWLPQIESMLATPEVELVLVGALHLAGDNNILQLLQQQGYSITQLE